MHWIHPVAKNMYEPIERGVAEPYVRPAPEDYYHRWLACFADCDFGADSKEEAESILKLEATKRRLANKEKI